METKKSARYDVELLTIGHDRDQLEQRLKRVKGLVLAPHEIVRSYPCTIAANISATASRKLVRYLQQLGVRVAIRKHNTSAARPSVVQSPAAPQASADLRSVRASEESSVAVYEPQRQSHSARPHTQLAPAEALTATEVSRSPTITLKRSVGELTSALQDKDWTTREHALIELGKVPSNGVMRHLVGALKDDVWRVRCTALDVLSRLGSETGVREMAKCVDDDVWHVRYQAVEALGRIESDRVIKPLVAALHDSNWQVRRRAVQMLGNLQSTKALQSLVACLQDEVWYVRESAAEALARMKSEKSVKALVGALEDPNWRVRSMVVTALGEIGSERAIRALIDRLRDDSWMVHWKAAYALGKIGTPGVFQVLSRLARTNNAFLENASKEVLQSLDVVTVPEKQTVPRLEYRSSDPYATMRLIPAGPFIMGNESGHDDEKPARQVFVPDFLIDAHEVTNYQYKQFDPAHDYPEGMEHFPVVNVTWADAQAYAAWIGKRLPTEAEWEKAARGDQGWLYPWGEEFEAARCNTEESGNRQLTRVDQYPNGQSPFGVYDLLGNVLEWTADRYRPYPGSQYPTPDFQENFVVLRGSSWIHQGRGLTCAARTYAPAENKSNFIGFRCVKNVE